MIDYVGNVTYESEKKKTDDCQNNLLRSYNIIHKSLQPNKMKMWNLKRETIIWTCSLTTPYERIILTVRKKTSNFNQRSGQGSGTCEVGTPAITSAYASRFFHYTLWSSSVKLDVYQLPCYLLPEGRQQSTNNFIQTYCKIPLFFEQFY